MEGITSPVDAVRAAIVMGPSEKERRGAGAESCDWLKKAEEASARQSDA